jgi:two-component system OmpR family response regulator
MSNPAKDDRRRTEEDGLTPRVGTLSVDTRRAELVIRQFGKVRLTPMKVLLIEDDEQTTDFIGKGLREAGHTVDQAANGRDGLFFAAGGSYDVMIVDRMLPGLDGLGIVRTIRSAGVRTPVLFLTTMSGIDDRVQGLEAGGDDYLVKPFAFAELLARLQALVRRPPLSDTPTVLKVADLEMDLLKRTVTRAGEEVDLQPREFQLLEYLMRNAGRVVTRTMLLENVWDFHFDPKTNIVETHVSRLRTKLGRNRAAELIHTVRGAGYVLRAPS